MLSINDLAQRLRGGFDDLRPIPALVGRVEANGAITVRVAGEVNQIWVRLFDSTAQTVSAYNIAVTPRPGAQVWVNRTPEGVYSVVGLREKAATEQYGEAAATVNTPELIGETLRMVLPSEQFKPGRVRQHSSGALAVFIEPFVQGGNVLGNQVIDLTATVGAITTGYRAWVVLTVDTLNAVTINVGTESVVTFPSVPDDAYAVSVPAGDMRLWAYNFAAGDTALPTAPTRIVDLRTFISAPVVPGTDAQIPIDLQNDDYTVATNRQVTVGRFVFSGAGALVLNGEVYFA